MSILSVKFLRRGFSQPETDPDFRCIDIKTENSMFC